MKKSNLIIHYLILTLISFLMIACNSGSGGSANNVSDGDKDGSAEKHYAYIINSNNSYTQCAVGGSGIEVNSCTTVPIPNDNDFSTPLGITISNGYAYIINNIGSYTQCVVGESGIEVNSCTTVSPSGNGTLMNPSGIAASGGYVYIANTSNNSYVQCSIGDSGIDQRTCNAVAPGYSQLNPRGLLNSPVGVAASSGHVYFTNISDSDNYIQCSTNNSGIDPNSCITTIGNSLMQNPSTIAVGSGYAIITNGYNFYTQCSVTTTGIDQATCVLNQFSALSGIAGVAISNRYAYFVGNGNSVIQCQVKSGSGVVSSSCTTTTPSGTGTLNSPIAIYVD